MRRFTLLLCLATACAGPTRTARPGDVPAGAQAGPSGTPGQPGEPEPTGAFARELPSLAKHTVDSPERVFTAEVEATAPPTLARHEGSTRLDIPLGTQAALACFVYERPLDAAGALLAVAKAVGSGPGVTVRRMTPTEVIVVAGAPALFFRVDYEAAGTRAGQVKLMMSTSRELPLLCAHDEPGYAKTFRRITTDLAQSLRVPGRARPVAHTEELHVLKLDGRLAGFEWRTSRSVEGGFTRTESTTSLLLPVVEGRPTGAEDTSSQRPPGTGGGLRAADTTIRQHPPGTGGGLPAEDTTIGQRSPSTGGSLRAEDTTISQRSPGTGGGLPAKDTPIGQRSPGTGGGLRAEDSTTTTLTDERGHLTELRHARADNGTLALQVTLRREREPAARASPTPEPATSAERGSTSATRTPPTPEPAASAERGSTSAPRTPPTPKPATSAERGSTSAPRTPPTPEPASPAASGGETATPEDLTPPGTSYRYEGRQGSRALKGTFTSKRGLATEDTVRTALRRWLLSGSRPEVVLDVYRPDIEVTAPMELTLRREASPSAPLTLTVGASTATARANPQGLLEWMETSRPEGKLTSELIHSAP
jgi:hypothetical protein